MDKEILVVDDQPGIRLLLQDILTNVGYLVTTTATGKEALERLRLKAFDGIILDYKLPVINGLDVLLQMKNDNIQTPAIMITGMKEEVLNEFAKRGLEVEVLEKPFNVEEICSMTQSMLQD